MAPYSIRSTRAPRRSRPGPDGPYRLRLLPSGDGWSLVGTDGSLVFSALGMSGRQRCLEFARSTGVVALSS